MSKESPVIVAAIDQSDMLESVVTKAKHLADCMKGSLVILHVITEKATSLANASYGDLVLGSIDEEVTQIDNEVRANLAPRLESVGIKASVLELVEGSPAKAVQEQLVKRDASMLVVGQPKAVLGSVATNMAKHAMCDVYIVRVHE